MADQATTFHAPATRTAGSHLAKQSALFTQDHLFTDLMNRVPAGLFTLNGNRQIVYANTAALGLADGRGLDEVRGLRPGELVGCTHSFAPGGCGTTKACRHCGAVNAILKSQTGLPDVEECHLLLCEAKGGAALDLRVWASPLDTAGERFTFLALLDIEDEKRRQFLEKSFLFDIRNSTSALKGFLSLLETDEPDELRREGYLHNVQLLADQILTNINAQKTLLAAENGELTPRPAWTSSRALVDEVFAGHDRPDLKDGRSLVLAEDCADLPVETDAALLKQVLAAMVKNAIEAAVPGEAVTMGCMPSGDRVCFWVHNPTYMPENVRLQVFNRSFSTKGAGRGLGTYSMKILTDHFLGGEIGFTSSEAAGTRFMATYPRVFRDPRQAGPELSPCWA